MAQTAALADRLIDFSLLPHAMHPTGLTSSVDARGGILAQGDDIVFVFYLDNVAQELKAGHRRAISALLRYNHDDAPGTLLAVVLWGHEGSIARAIEVLGPLPEDRREVTTIEVQKWFSDWYNARRMTR